MIVRRNVIFARAGVGLRATLVAACALLIPRALHSADPPPSGATIAVTGLAGPVEILTDRWGIPHLKARSLSDLYFAWGFTIARDRLWQLEVARRGGRGRMWEWLGNSTLRADGGAQLFELGERAERIWERERRDPAVAMPLERYAAGVNAWIARCRAGLEPWPPEFARLHRTPADWKPSDSVLVLLGIGVLLDFAVPELREGQDIAHVGRAEVIARRRFEDQWIYDTVPDSAARRRYPAASEASSARWPASDGGLTRQHAPGGDPARAPVPPTLPAGLVAHARAALAGWMPERDTDGGDRASNVFAVGAGRSASGRPLLANDPHLDLAVPSPLHVIHVTVPGIVDAAGAEVPGLPAIVSGRNADCAWGVTALSADVVDVYADTISADGRSVRWHGGWAPVREAPFALRYRVLGVPLPVPGQARRYTPHGAVISWDRHQRVALSVRWTATEEALIHLGPMLGVERATSAAELATRYRALVTPTLNLVAADRGGHVIYQACGLLPRRAADPGPGPLPGDGRHEWTGFIPADRMPSWSPPASGFVVNANNRPVGPAYPEVLPRFDWAHDRARRIAQRIAGTPRLTIEDLGSIQNDVVSLAAQRMLPRMLACADSLRPSLSPRARATLDTLRGWDFAARRWRVAPTLYRSWYATLERRWHAAGLPGYVLARLDGRAAPLADAPIERPAVGAAAALDSALADLGRLLGPSLPRWTWGRAHRARFAHALTGIDRSRRWEPPPVPVDGDNSTVCVGPSRLPRTVDVTHAPVFRHLVDLAVAESSWVASPPGEAAGATDLLAAWANHGYLPLYLAWDRAEAARRQILTLLPPGR